MGKVAAFWAISSKGATGGHKSHYDFQLTVDIPKLIKKSK